MKATRINYDILVYLPEDIETIEGEKHFIRWIQYGRLFNSNSRQYEKQRNWKFSKRNQKKLDNVEQVISASDIIGSNIPIESIPNEIKEKYIKTKVQ